MEKDYQNQSEMSDLYSGVEDNLGNWSGDMPRTVSILGSTGSIGKSTLDLIEKSQGQFVVKVLTAHNQVQLLAEQALKFHPDIVVIVNEDKYDELDQALKGTEIKILTGVAGLIEAASQTVDFTMAAIVGIAGLAPTVAAIKHSSALGLANKESMVCAGTYIQKLCHQYKTKLIPVDSEHNAIFQVLGGVSDSPNSKQIKRLILTASGGPFISMTREQMATKTPEEAVKHPTWSMGKKISVDSATLMNKALELIEAHYLFNVAPHQLDVVVHRQSIAHSFVEYTDGSVLGQFGPSDMRCPISYALCWPNRLDYAPQAFDLLKVGSMTFEAPDDKKFPLLALAKKALSRPEILPLVLNAANEVAVDAFLSHQIGFLDIEAVIFESFTYFETFDFGKPPLGEELDFIARMDRAVRDYALLYINDLQKIAKRKVG